MYLVTTTQNKELEASLVPGYTPENWEILCPVNSGNNKVYNVFVTE